MTKCIKRIRDLFEYTLYKFTLYLLTYDTSTTIHWVAVILSDAYARHLSSGKCIEDTPVVRPETIAAEGPSLAATVYRSTSSVAP